MSENYLNLFIDESKENLEKLNDSLLKLENDSDETETLNDIFRVAHTLKGMSKSMGFNDMGDLTHNMENVLDEMRQGKLKTTGNIIDILFNCLDKLQELVDKITDGVYKDDSNNIEKVINNLLEIINAPAKSEHNNEPAKNKKIVPEDATFNQFELSTIQCAVEKGFCFLKIEINLSKECVLPGVRAYMAMQVIKEPNEVIKTCPNVEALENGDFEDKFTLYVICQNQVEEISSALKNITDIETVVANEFDLSDVQIDQPEVKREQPDKKTNEAKVDKADKADKATASKTTGQTIRVNSEKLSSLMDMVGELVINRTRVDQLASEHELPELKNAVDMMGGITTDIQEVVMTLRMVPIEQSFHRFPRLVRDISKSLNKKINLKLTGIETEIDRLVIEEIGDPLIHLVRNSLDHGIEIPEERVKSGKPEVGTIELAAFNEGDNIIIKIIDDGKGIDAQKIKCIALEKGLINEEEASSLTESEMLDLIFMPGLSSAKETTDLSGRGVGMDVVKSKITALGGAVNISSVVGLGSEITICLPSTMAIIQALLVGISNETYALPLNNVSEVIEIEKNEIKIVNNQNVFVLREHILPVIKLSELLETPEVDNAKSEAMTLIIVKAQDKLFALVVDNLIGQQEVVIKPINKKLCPANYISGATTLGNGEIAFILNVNGLI